MKKSGLIQPEPGPGLRTSCFSPELIESAMYLFRATDDHTYLQLGLDALESIERIAKTPCGYASVSTV